MLQNIIVVSYFLPCYFLVDRGTMMMSAYLLNRLTFFILKRFCHVRINKVFPTFFFVDGQYRWVQ